MSNPLQAQHEQSAAEFQPYAETPIVSTFGLPQAEYAAIRKSAAILDMPQRGILELTGRDRLPFLNNLLTNQTWNKETKAPLAAHAGVYAFFLNIKGRIVTDMNVLELGERTLLEMDARLVAPTLKAFERYLFAEQVKMNDCVDSLHELLLMGPNSLEVLNASLASPIGELSVLGSAEAKLLGHDVVIFHDDSSCVPGYGIICPVEVAAEIWKYFTENESATAEAAPTEADYRFRGRARPVGWAAFNATRIEAGRPFFGIDFDESVLPAETGQLARAVSFTKGCYLGQEIVARMHARGQLARQLVGIKMEGDALPIAGAKIYDENQNEVGGITSSTVSPVLSNAAICLGYVKKPFIAAGSKVSIPAEGSMRVGVVTELPFSKS
jgi:aminomethyltransferase